MSMPNGFSIHASFHPSHPIQWRYSRDNSEGCIFGATFSQEFTQLEDGSIQALADMLKSEKADWLAPLGHPTRAWALNFDKFGDWLSSAGIEGPKFDGFSWLRGTVPVHPHAWCDEKVAQGRVEFRYPSRGKGLGTWLGSNEDSVLTESLHAFAWDNRDYARTGFVMMRFGSTSLHHKIFDAVKTSCVAHRVTVLRADERTYSDDLLGNIRTFMHGSSFGIAIFDRLTTDDFNPNVSLEVGYMMALGKPVCLLKDQTLRSLHTDLVGRLYESFDPQNPATSIPSVLERWLRTKEFIA